MMRCISMIAEFECNTITVFFLWSQAQKFYW